MPKFAPFLFKCCLLLLCCGSVLAQTPIIELNRVRGVWDLNGNLNSYWACQPPMNLGGFSVNPGYVTESSYQFLRLTTGTTSTQYLEMPTVGGANGFTGAVYMNNWTLIMDVRIPLVGTSTDPKAYISLLQDFVTSGTTSADDAEFFVTPTGGLYVAGAGAIAPANTVPRNTWIRLGMRATYNATTTNQDIQYFLNGNPVGSVASVARDGRFALGPYAFLFNDNNNETAALDVNSIGFWSQSLSNSSIASTGSPSASGLNWSGLLGSSYCPPLPVLTGVLKAGSVNLSFTAATQQNDGLLFIQDPVVAGTVARVVLDLPSQDGKVPGKPRHYFQGTTSADVLPNGDCVLLSNKTLQVLPDPVYGTHDIESVANILFERVDTRATGTGIYAMDFKLHLPVGLQASASETSRRMKGSLGSNGGAPTLDANLLPTAAVSWTAIGAGGSFGDPLYVSFDRLPIRWRTPALTWNPAAGTITFDPDYTYDVHHREPQIAAMEALGRKRPSNDGMFRYVATSTSVTLSALSGSIVSVNLAGVFIDPTKFPGGSTGSFETHFPKGWTVQWNGTSSNIVVQNDAIKPTSKLSGASAVSVPYERGCPDPDCDAAVGTLPKVSRAMTFTPTSGNWLWTKDLGLRADGVASVPSGAMLDWGYTSPTFDYAHRLLQNFPSARAMTAGIGLRGAERTTAAADSPAALLLSGLESPTDATLTERPGTTPYDTGAADYPGVNFRVPNSTFTARSLLAGEDSAPYALTTESKYYTRISGVSGKHVAAADTNTSFTAFGGNLFQVSAMRLGFLSGRNVASGVKGKCQVLMPLTTQFQLDFDRLTFGCGGNLLGANLSATQAPFTLSYWGNVFTPTALDFPQPHGCPPPDPNIGMIRLTGTSVFPALSSQPMTGTLGFADGDLVSESQPTALVGGVTTPIANGLGTISRFQPNGTITVAGPGGTGWQPMPQGGAYLNRFTQRDTATTSPDRNAGTINFAALVDVPFFVDMPVHVSAPSAASASLSNSVFFRNTFSGGKYYDPEHRGRPSGSDLLVYLNDGSYDPHAKKTWLDFVQLDYPLMQDSSRRFRSRAPIVDEALKIMKLSHEVASLTPSTAELNFKGEVNIDPAGILSGITVEGLLNATEELFPGAASGASTALTNGSVAALFFDRLMTDDASSLLFGGLDTVSGTVATSLHTQLSASPTATTLNNIRPTLASNMTGLFGAGTTGLNGQWRRDLDSQLASVEPKLVSLQGVVDDAAKILSLANSLRTRLGVGNMDSAAITRMETVRAELSAAITRVRSAVATARTALGAAGNFTLALAAALPAENSGVSESLNSLVQLALNDLQAKWNTQAVDLGASFFVEHNAAELRSDLTQALADRVLGSQFGGKFLSLLRMHLGDTQYVLRQAVDDTMALLKNAAKDAISDTAKGVLGALGGFSGMASVTGNAHINGDTLNELRVDGKIAMALGGEALGSTDSLKVDGYFILRDVDSTTPGGLCRASYGAKSEILAGAKGIFSWGNRTSGGVSSAGLDVNGKFTLDDTGGIIGLAGDAAILGNFGFQDVNFKELKLGFGFGAGDAYMYGRASAALKAMDVTAGIFIGQTCDIGILRNVDKDIESVMTGLNLDPGQPYIGAAAYAEGSMSLMPIIGIPPSCVLDLRVGGGQGVFVFKQGSALVAGIKQLMSIRGELLCLVDVTGQLAYVIAGSGNLDGSNLQATGFGRATVTGEVGWDPFSYDFEKTLTMKVHAAPLTWKLDY